MEDVLYAVHRFEAENEDELTFDRGERIVVLERDEQYSDGWYKGRNVRGEVGLFPESYAASRPPSLAESNEQEGGAAKTDADQGDHATPRADAGAFPVVITATETPPTASPPAPKRRNSDGGASLHSHVTEEDDDEGDEDARSRLRQSEGANHRAALAAKVSQNAERDAREARELAERRKRQDEARYARSAGLVDGLQLSDESDDDDEALEEPVESFLPLPAPLPTSSATSPTTELAVSPAAPEERPELRPRGDTEVSGHSESDASVYAPEPSPGPAVADAPVVPPVADQAPALDPEETAVLEAPTGAVDATEAEKVSRNGDTTPTSPSTAPRPVMLEFQEGSTHSLAGMAATAAGAGLAGAAGAAAFHNYQGPTTAAETPGMELEPRLMAVSETEEAGAKPATESDAPAPAPAPAPALAPVSPPVEPASLVAASAIRAETVPLPETPAPLAVDTSSNALSPRPQLAATPRNVTGSSVSPPPSLLRSPTVAWDSLPADPFDWGVDDVVNWGQQKGFDEGILSKFAEHEITGDVLLEMDVHMLKEIDLVAFGRRVRVYNGIKELRQRTQQGNLMASVSYASGFTSPSVNGFDHTEDVPGAPLAGLGLPEELTPAETVKQETTLAQQQPTVPPVPIETDVRSPEGPSEKSPAQKEVEGDADSLEKRVEQEQPPLSSTASSLRPKSSRRSQQTEQTATEATAPTTEIDPAATPPLGRERSRGEKSGFFGGTLPGLPATGRNRKPPPRVPSALLMGSDGAVPRQKSRSTFQDRAKRSTRLFSSLGASSGSERSPTTGQSVRSRPSNSTIAAGRDAPTAMSVKSVDPATEAMMRKRDSKVMDGNLMDKIGRPDHSGWMRKKGEKYNTWKMRFFVLKGTYLYYLKSEAEQRAKGVIDLTGYRVVSDPDIRPGEFAFKLVHEKERAHYFAAAEQITIRTWMKEILKATIFRDYSDPVVSSCDIDVLSLEAAKSRSPRPPSPARRAEIQKRRYAGSDPNTLSQKDAAILMELAPGSPYSNGENLSDSVARRPMVAEGEAKKAPVTSLEAAQAGGEELAPPVGAARHASPEPQSPPKERGSRSVATTQQDPTLEASKLSDGEILPWMNANLPPTCPPATDLSSSLRSGRLIVRLLENLSGQSSGITDAAFDQFNKDAGSTFDPAYLDTLFSVFDYINPLASTEDISMEDMVSGNPPRMKLLLARIRTNFPGSQP
ncbi:hypothetical protein JCM8202v2_000986 [Rhodotorula sphaerocarpa]